jgi:MoxR-like ATPase
MSWPMTGICRRPEKAGRSSAMLDQVIARRRAVHARVMTEVLGEDASVVAASL